VHFNDSLRANRALVDSIRRQALVLDPGVLQDGAKARRILTKEKAAAKDKEYEEFLFSDAPDNLKRRVQANAQAPLSSRWLSALPLEAAGYVVGKEDWHDLVAARFALPFADTPTFCGCGEPYSEEHELTCPLGGLIMARHDGIRDWCLKMLQGVFKQLRTEPSLHELSDEQKEELKSKYRTSNLGDHPRGDFSVVGFWREHQRAYFDVRVWNHLAPSNSNAPSLEVHRRHERAKRREYDARIQLENGSFCPLVFSSNGGVAPAAQAFLSHLSAVVEKQKGISRGVVASFMYTELSFSLARAFVACLRGTHEKGDMTVFNRLSFSNRGVVDNRPLRDRFDIGAIEQIVADARLPEMQFDLREFETAVAPETVRGPQSHRERRSHESEEAEVHSNHYDAYTSSLGPRRSHSHVADARPPPTCPSAGVKWRL